MSTSRSVEYLHQAPLAAVFALQCDQDYLRRRTEADGDRDVVVQVQRSARAVEISIARRRTLELPAFVRNLVKPSNHTVETMRWQPTQLGYAADYRVMSKGLPGALRGVLTLEHRAAGCIYRAEFEVEAHVPLLGRKLEQLMAAGFADYLVCNAERDATALRGE